MREDIFTVDRSVQSEVFTELENFSAYEKLAGEKIPEADGYSGIAQSYEQHASGNLPSSRTEKIVLRAADRKQQIEEARRKVSSIEKGIDEAARGARTADFKNIKRALTASLIYRIPAIELEIEAHALAKYRRRAVYYIALELGIIDDETA